LKIVIQQLEKYLKDKKDLGKLVFALDRVIDQFSDDDARKDALRTKWGKLEIFYAVFLDADRDPTEDELKKICLIVTELRDIFLQEANKYYTLPAMSAISKEEFLQECNSLIQKSKLQSTECQDFVDFMADLIKRTKEEYPNKSDIISAWAKLYDRSLDKPKVILQISELEELEKILTLVVNPISN